MLLHRISAGWARVELICAALRAALVTCLILLNVVTRSLRVPIYGVDEAAIYAMVRMTFLAASAAIERREAISVTLFVDMVRPAVARMIWLFVDAVTLILAGLMLWFCWIWFLPVEPIAAGFDLRAFRGATFNFIDAEPTPTLGLPKYWVWLIMPVFARGIALHALSNLVKSLPGRVPGTGESATEGGS